jgi:hypothetical protein
MSIIKTSNIRLLRQSPLDDKTYMTLAESNSLILAEMYAWMEFVDPDDGKRYRLQPKTPNDITSTNYKDNWEFVEYLSTQEGQKGGYTKYIFKRSTDVDGPTIPTTADPTIGEGWSNAPYLGEGILWMTSAKFDGNNNISGLGWSAPIQVEGSTYTTRFIFTAAENKPNITGADSTNFNITNGGVWHNEPPDSNLPIWVSKGVSNEYGLMVASWSDPIRWTGQDGNNATSEIFIFKRAASQPLRPNDDGLNINNPVGSNYGDWQYAPYTSANNEDKLWMATARFKEDVLVTGWSTPIDIEGDDGYEIEFVFKGSAEQPGVPQGNIPAGWSFDPDGAVIIENESQLPIWASKAVFKKGNVQGNWSTPVKWNGLDGEDAYSVFLTNDNHSYHADSNEIQEGNWVGGYSQIRVYKGITQFQCVDANVNGVGPEVNNTYKLTNIEQLIGSMVVSTHIVGGQLEIRPVSMATNACVLRLTIVAQSKWVDTTIVKYISYSMMKDGESAWAYHLSNPDFSFISDGKGGFNTGYGYNEAKSEFVIMIGSQRLKHDGVTHQLGEATENNTYKVKQITPLGFIPPTNRFQYELNVSNEQLIIEPTNMNMPIAGLLFTVSVMYKGNLIDIELKQSYKLTSPLAGEWNIYTDKTHYTFLRNADGSLNGDFSAGNITLFVNKGSIKFNCVNAATPGAGTNAFGQLSGSNSPIYDGDGSDFVYDVYPVIGWGQGSKPIDFEYDLVTDEEDPTVKHFRLKPVSFASSTNLTVSVTFYIRVRDVGGKIMMIYRSVTFTIQDLSMAASYTFAVDKQSIPVASTGLDANNDGKFNISGFFGAHASENPLPYNNLLTAGTWKINSTVVSPAGSVTLGITTSGNTATLTPSNLDFGVGGSIAITVNIQYKDPQDNIHTYTKHLNYVKLNKADDGTGAVMLWKRSATKPDTPTGNNPAGWFINPYDEDNQNKRLWMSLNYKAMSGDVVGTWSDPVQVDSLPDEATLIQIIQDAFSTLLAELVQRVEALEYLTGTTHHDKLIELENRLDALEATP